MLDGAARFVADAVDPTVWDVMHSRETPPAVLQDRLDSELDGPDWTPMEKVLSAAKLALANRSAFPSELVNSVGTHLIAIPSGEFMMGVADADNRFPFPVDAIPHRVRITRPFYLGAFEVNAARIQCGDGLLPRVGARREAVARKRLQSRQDQRDSSIPCRKRQLERRRRVLYTPEPNPCREGRGSRLSPAHGSGVGVRLPCRNLRSDPSTRQLDHRRQDR